MSDRDSIPSKSSESGSAMIGVILMTVICSMLVASVMQYSTHQGSMTRRSLDFQKSQVAAESALQFGMRELRREALKQRLFPDKDEMQAHLDARLAGLNNVASAFSPDYALHTEDGYHTLYIEAENDVVRDEPIGEGAYASWRGDRQNFTITAGARNPETGEASAYEIKVQLVSINMIRFAIFYEDDLEFLPGAEMDVLGPVHTNQDLYLRPVSNLNLHGRVRTAGDFIFRGKDGRENGGNLKIKTDNDQFLGVRNAGSDGQHLDSNNQNWTGEALERWQDQRFLSSAHNVQPLRPPIAPSDMMIDLIQRPRSKSSSEYQNLSDEEKEEWQTTENGKFATRAAVTIHVDSSGKVTATNFYGDDVTDKLEIGAELLPSEEHDGEYLKDDDGPYLLTNSAAMDISARFTDGRENETMAPIDLYVDNLIDQLGDELDVSEQFNDPNEDKSSGLLYITRDTPADGAMPAVRLRNGAEIDSNRGLSLTSDNPVYIEGNFNIVDPKPSMVAGDAVSMLSRSWQDTYSSDGHKSRPSRVDTEETVFNTVVMTGNTDTIPFGQYNGGVENIFRLLEDWDGTKHVFRGSIICLWNSLHADSDWSYGNYYTAPSRDWGYDHMYATKSPPGMVRVFGLEELEWRRLTYEEAQSVFQKGPKTAVDPAPSGQGQGQGQGPPGQHPGQGQGPDGTGPPGAEHWPEPSGNIPEFPF